MGRSHGLERQVRLVASRQVKTAPSESRARSDDSIGGCRGRSLKEPPQSTDRKEPPTLVTAR